MGLPVFFPQPEIVLELPAGKPTSLPELCRACGVPCKVTGLSARRPLRISETAELRVARIPGALSGIWVGIPPVPPARRALLALGLLAFSAFDYGARETLRGRPEAFPSTSAGRPRSRRALTAAERQRRHRERSRTSNTTEKRP